MNSLLIIGAGQLGNVVKEIAIECGYTDIKFLDDCIIREDVIDKIKDIELYSDYDLIIAIGNNQKRFEVIQSLSTSCNLISLIHPKSYVSASAMIGKGCIVMPLACVNTEVVIEDGSIVGVNATVEHNSHLGKCTHLDCGGIVCANSYLSMLSKVNAREAYRSERYEFEIGV